MEQVPVGTKICPLDFFGNGTDGFGDGKEKRSQDSPVSHLKMGKGGVEVLNLITGKNGNGVKGIIEGFPFNSPLVG